MADEDEVGLGKSVEFGGLGRIDVDGFASGLNENAGVSDGSNFHVSGRGGKRLCLGSKRRA
jgi:hypothetical protein